MTESGDSPMPSGSELGDSEIDEWAEVAEVEEVISGTSDESKQTEAGAEAASPAQPVPLPMTRPAPAGSSASPEAAPLKVPRPPALSPSPQVKPALLSTPPNAKQAATAPGKPALVPPPSIAGSSKSGAPPAATKAGSMPTTEASARPPQAIAKPTGPLPAPPSRRPPPLKPTFAPQPPPPTASTARPATVTPTTAASAAGAGDKALHAPPAVEITPDSPGAGDGSVGPKDEAPDQGSFWGGWGGGWNALGSSLSSAVGSAVKDVADLGASFQQVLTEIAEDADAPDDESSPTRSTAAAGGASEATAPAVELDDHHAEVLERLSGPETNLERGLKSLDEGVDRVAASALSTLGGLLTAVGQAASSAAREVIETVDQGVKEVKDLPAVKKASTNLASAPKHAAGLLQKGGNFYERIGGFVDGNMRSLLGGGPSSSDPYSDAAAGPVSFDNAFQRHGGGAILEELESLSNECARAVNRVRAQLPPGGAGQGEGGREELDAMVATLHACFDLQAHQAGDEPQQETAGSSSMQPDKRLAAGHEMVHELVVSGIDRTSKVAMMAERHASQLAEALAAAVEAAGSGTAGSEGPVAGAAASEGPRAVAGTSGCSPTLQQASSDATAGGAAQEQWQSARVFLSGAHKEGTDKVGELAALCVERLLALGRSLSAQTRYGRPASDGIAWPKAGSDKAALLRGEARRMADEVAALAAAWRALLPAVASTLEDGLRTPAAAASDACSKASNAGAQQVGEGSLVAMAQQLVEAWQEEVASPAADRVQGAFRGLLNVVLYSTVDRAMLAAS